MFNKRIFLGALLLVATVAYAAGTTSNFFSIGDSTNTDKQIIADVGDGGTNPKMRYNASANVWQGSDDGSTFYNLSTVGANPSVNSVTANYTILDADGYSDIQVDANGAARTVTLPTAADNVNRTITVTKVDSDIGDYVTVDAEGAETINGLTTVQIQLPYESMTFISDGTEWVIVRHTTKGQVPFTPAYAGSDFDTRGTNTAYFSRIGNKLRGQVSWIGNTATGATNIALSLTLPASLTIDQAYLGGSAMIDEVNFGQVYLYDASLSDRYLGFVRGGTTTTVRPYLFFDDVSYEGLQGINLGDNTPFNNNTNDSLYFTFEVPILEWRL